MLVWSCRPFGRAGTAAVPVEEAPESEEGDVTTDAEA